MFHPKPITRNRSLNSACMMNHAPIDTDIASEFDSIRERMNRNYSDTGYPVDVTRLPDSIIEHIAAECAILRKVDAAIRHLDKYADLSS